MSRHTVVLHAALFAACSIAALSAAHAEPRRVTLPAGEMRSVELAKGTSIDEFIQRNEVEPLERIPLANGGAIVRFEMEEGVWRARSGALCTDNGVLACGTDFCQTYFVPQAAAETPPAATEQQDEEIDTEARLELRLIEEDADDGAGIDAQVVDSNGALVRGARVLMVPRAPSVEALFEDAPADIADPNAVAGERSCKRTQSSASSLLTALSSEKGGFSFPDAGSQNLDRGCWEMVTVSACQTRQQPLSDLLPEREPHHALVLVPLIKNAVGGDLMQRLGAVPGLRVIDSTVLTSVDRAIVRLKIEDATLDPQVVLAGLRGQAGVEEAQPDYRYNTSAQFNDPYAWMNYGAQLTGADKIMPSSSGAGVRVAVIDSGVDGEHPELAARVIEKIDVTGYGYSADRHGTAIAGLIAGEANNEVGAFGMAPAASLIAIKACEPASRGAVASRCWSSTIAKALDAALQRDVPIINMSLAGPQDPLVSRLVDAAIAKGRLVIAAAGNGGPDAKPSFPASHPGVLAVTAIDPRARTYAQATRGSYIDVAAPGVEVPVPVPGSTYPGQLSGTSMASAHVAGVAALLLSSAPKTTAVALRDALQASAVPVVSAKPEDTGKGRIDACAASLALGEQLAGCVTDATAAPKQPSTAAASDPQGDQQ